MNRLCIAFALVIMAGRADAQDNVRYVTNNVLALSASANPLSYYRDFDIRLKVLAKRGGSVQNLTNTFIRWVILDKRDMQESVAVDGYIIGDPANGMATAVASMRDLEPGAYQGVMTAYDVLNSNKVADLSLNDITLSDWCDGCVSGGGGGGTTIITQQLMIAIGGSTTLVEATFSPINNFTNQLILSIGGVTSTVFVGDTIVNNTNIVNMVNNIGGVQVFTSNDVSYGFDGGTSTPGFVRFYGGGVLATGVVDGANLSLYVEGGGSGDSITNVFATYPLFATNFMGNFYLSYLQTAGFLVAIPFSNVATFDYTGTTQTVTVVGYTQMIAHVWGAGSGGSAYPAGYSEALFWVTNGEVLRIVVGQGGQFVTGGVSGVVTSDYAFGGGGRGASRANGSGGGGASWVMRSDGTLILGAGGAGGRTSSGTAAGPAGGGATGGGALGVATGEGGTQTAGGRTPTSGANLMFTNTAGSYLQGGDGGITNGYASAGAVGGGGGGVPYGGGGGFQTGTSDATGGGGAGMWNTNQCIFGTTIRGSSAVAAAPPLSESPYYPVRTPAVGASGASTHLSRGGNGAVVLRNP